MPSNLLTVYAMLLAWSITFLNKPLNPDVMAALAFARWPLPSPNPRPTPCCSPASVCSASWHGARLNKQPDCSRQELAKTPPRRGFCCVAVPIQRARSPGAREPQRTRIHRAGAAHAASGSVDQGRAFKSAGTAPAGRTRQLHIKTAPAAPVLAGRALERCSR